MGGIPSARGAGLTPVLVRVLLRIAMLAGLIVGGWLLGSATAMAQDDSGAAAPDTVFAGRSAEPAPSSLLGAVPVVGSAVQDTLPRALSSTLSEASALPPLSKGDSLDTALSPVLHPVAETAVPDSGSPEPAAPTGPARTAPAPAAEADADTAADRTHSTSVTAPSTHRLVAATVQAAATPDRPAHPAPAQQVTKGGSGLATHPGHPAVPVPEGTAPTCPAGSGGSGATTHGSPSVTLDDQRDAAAPARAQPRLRSSDAGLPRWHTQRPSTSPD